MTDDKQFYAWLDGELDDDAAARVAARIAADPALAALAAQHRALRTNLRGAFAPVMAADAPPRRLSAEVVDLGARRAIRPSRFGLPQWAAMAATLVIGLVVGQVAGVPSDAPIESRGGAIVAAATLDRALGAQLASTGNDGPIRVGMTFRSRDGVICRGFTYSGASGLACRDGDTWRLEALLAAPQNPGGNYRMAAGEDPRLAALIDDRIDGEPFDATTEQAARAAGWH